MVVLARLPAEPARHRMALWRELRRSGAIPLGQAVWAVPDLPAVRPLLERLADLIEGANGTLLLLAAKGLTEVMSPGLSSCTSPRAKRNGRSSTPTVGNTWLSWTRKSGSASTHWPSSRRRSRASIGYAAGIASCGAEICSGFPQRQSQPQPSSRVRNSSRGTRTMCTRPSAAPQADHRNLAAGSLRGR